MSERRELRKSLKTERQREIFDFWMAHGLTAKAARRLAVVAIDPPKPKK